jgi:hypothetical protein
MVSIRLPVSLYDTLSAEAQRVRASLTDVIKMRLVSAEPIKSTPTDMRRFRIYRPNPPAGYLESGAANPPEETQLEGIVFSDGTVSVRWCTAQRSHSIWNCWKDFEAIHGHPEYGTIVEWLD